MTAIVVSPPKLQLLGMHLERKSSTLALIASQLQHSLGNLEWETRQKADMDGQVYEASRQAKALSAQLEALSQYTLAKARAFDETDMQCAAELSLFFESNPVPIITPPSPISNLPSLIQSFNGLKATIATLLLFLKENSLLKAVSVIGDMVDLLAVRIPALTKPFEQWEEYNNSPDFNPYIARQFEEKALEALKDFNFSSLKDGLDNLVEALPKNTDGQKSMKDLYSFLGAIQSWVETYLKK